MSKHKHLFKIVILGQSNVGKTSLLQQFVNKQYISAYKTTVGADFFSKQVTIDDQTVTLQIWDTAGQERFQSLGGAFYKGSDCCILVYDVTNYESFKSLEKWKNLFFDHCAVKSREQFPLVILGNKSDLKQQRKVSQSQAKHWQQKGQNIAYYETSAKQSINIQKAFHTVGRLALKNASNQPKLVPQSVTLHKKSPKRSQSSCKC